MTPGTKELSFSLSRDVSPAAGLGNYAAFYIHATLSATGSSSSRLSSRDTQSCKGESLTQRRPLPQKLRTLCSWSHVLKAPSDHANHLVVLVAQLPSVRTSNHLATAPRPHPTESSKRQRPTMTSYELAGRIDRRSLASASVKAANTAEASRASKGTAGGTGLYNRGRLQNRIWN